MKQLYSSSRIFHHHRDILRSAGNNRPITSSAMAATSRSRSIRANTNGLANWDPSS
uniref:Uncharacterized protein n=1 Tax=Oryza nivara TaxID=4536 RepID=A0A0E0GKK3_ORYNI